MPYFKCRNLEEVNAIEALKNRVRNDLTFPELLEDDAIFYKFLKAKSFDVDKAEKTLRKHLTWRKVHDVDNMLKTFKPKEVFIKFAEPCQIGFDKDGNFVKFSACGRIVAAEILKCIKMNEYMKNWIWYLEKCATLSKQQIQKAGEKGTGSIIVDLDKLEFLNATSRASAAVFIRLAQIIRDHYAERIKAIYIINAPSYFKLIYGIIKAVLTNAILKKIHVFGYSDWKETLLEAFGADILPVFLGGKRTDSDGDPYCKSFINFPGKLYDQYYLSEEERYFTDNTDVKTLLISPMEKKEIFVHVNEEGSTIYWKFMVQNKTIRFGLFFQESQEEMKEIIPIYEYETYDGTEENSYTCSCKGKYIVVFENTHSRYTSKRVQYVISVKKAWNII